MDALNRLLASILGLLLIATGVLGILAITGVLDAQGFLDGFFAEPINRLSTSSGTEEVVSYTVCSLLIAVGVALLALELWFLASADQMIVIADGPSGTTQVSSRSVVRLAERIALSNHDVTACSCDLSAAPEGLTIACKTQLRMGADVPRVTSEVQSSIRDAVESLLGVPVSNVYIRAKYGRRAEHSLVAG